MSETQAILAFDQLGIESYHLQRLHKLGITVPTPIQALAIPLAIKRKDLIGIAQTGTGKTLAFSLPMLMNLGKMKQGLVLAPTRELALQIEATYKKLGGRTAVLIGAAPMNRQVAAIRTNPQVIVATPGRLLDHLQQGTLSLKHMGIVVLDEADRMLDMGFAPTIKRILAMAPKQRQTMLFSATMPEEIEVLARQYMIDPEKVSVERQGTTSDLIEQELFVVEKANKVDLLEDILAREPGSVLIFARTRHGARKLTRSMRDIGHSAAEIHSDRTLSQRRLALEGFKAGDYRILIATDIASRGIDVKDIALVVNFDLPDNPEDYVHRIGRTGRAGSEGRAVTFASPDQRRDLMDIERLIQFEIPLSESSPLEMKRPPLKKKPTDVAEPRVEQAVVAVAKPAPKPAQPPQERPKREYREERPQRPESRPAGPSQKFRGGGNRPGQSRGPQQDRPAGGSPRPNRDFGKPFDSGPKQGNWHGKGRENFSDRPARPAANSQPAFSARPKGKAFAKSIDKPWVQKPQAEGAATPVWKKRTGKPHHSGSSKPHATPKSGGNKSYGRRPKF